MSELKIVVVEVQDPMAHQLFHAFGGLGRVQIRRALEQRPLERTPDHRRNRRKPAAAVPEPLDTMRDQLADALRDGQRRRSLRRLATAQRSHGLDDHERVALARPPELLVEWRGLA